MSVYSGFATRQQETFYNKLLDKMIQLISVKLIQSMKRIEEVQQQLHLQRQNPILKVESQDQATEEMGEKQKGIRSEESSPDSRQILSNKLGLDSERKWLQYVRKIFNALHNMDKQKYLEPKFSQSICPIIKFLQKRHGGGGAESCTQTNISMMSNGNNQEFASGSGASSMPKIVYGNDTLSVSSLLSLDTNGFASNKRGSEISQFQNNNSISRTAMLVDDQKLDLAQTTDPPLIKDGPGQQSCVIEQSVEDDEEDRSSSVKTGANIRLRATAQSEMRSRKYNPPEDLARSSVHYAFPEVSKKHPALALAIGSSPHPIEPVLKMKQQTSRTVINGVNSSILVGAQEFINNGLQVQEQSHIQDSVRRQLLIESKMQSSNRRNIIGRNANYSTSAAHYSNTIQVLSNNRNLVSLAYKTPSMSQQQQQHHPSSFTEQQRVALKNSTNQDAAGRKQKRSHRNQQAKCENKTTSQAREAAVTQGMANQLQNVYSQQVHAEYTPQPLNTSMSQNEEASKSQYYSDLAHINHAGGDNQSQSNGFSQISVKWEDGQSQQHLSRNNVFADKNHQSSFIYVRTKQQLKHQNHSESKKKRKYHTKSSNHYPYASRESAMLENVYAPTHYTLDKLGMKDQKKFSYMENLNELVKIHQEMRRPLAVKK